MFISQLLVLRYIDDPLSTVLNAVTMWDLTDDLPTVGSNLGFEAIAWIPDSFLVARGYFDESASMSYDPARYANHGSGLFFLGLEGSTILLCYVYL